MSRSDILFINLGNFGSTGTIMREIGALAKNEGYTCYYGYPESIYNKKKEENDIIICSAFSKKVAEKMSYFTGLRCIWLRRDTRRFLKKIDEIKPSIIHLNNLHDTYINLGMLFSYIKRNNIQVVWTLHDCWAYTGHCPHYAMAKCDKWKTGCHKCQQLKYYPHAKVDCTRIMWSLKKKWFTGVPKMRLVTPSKWLAKQVSESFLKEYPISVINNGIDISIFKPIKSNFRSSHNLEDKYIVLGVAFDWSEKKGIDVFIKLAEYLDDKYSIILVGTDDSVDRIIPSNIISIHRTHNQRELSELYSTADVFVNTTREEVLGLVNIEALSCGTPVITFDSGGSPECISSKSGIIIENEDLNILVSQIKNVCENRIFKEEDCINRAKDFDKNIKYREYLDLYYSLLNEKGIHE